MKSKFESKRRQRRQGKWHPSLSVFYRKPVRLVDRIKGLNVSGGQYGPDGQLAGARLTT